MLYKKINSIEKMKKNMRKTRKRENEKNEKNEKNAECGSRTGECEYESKFNVHFWAAIK